MLLYELNDKHLADEICEKSADLSLLATACATSVSSGWLPPCNTKQQHQLQSIMSLWMKSFHSLSKWTLRFFFISTEN